MELDILENTKNRFKFKIKGEGHSFCNILRKELWTDKNIDISGYHIQHSLVSDPIFTVQTTTGDPKKALLHTVERLQKTNKHLLALFAKL